MTKSFPRRRESDIDAFFMQRALALAARGRGRVHPNPLVGAVLVKRGKIIGEGAHERFGGPHAEVNAILSAERDASGATLYVTLEPCAHFGKTPPCTDLILKNKIKKVVVAAQDANPMVSEKGLRILKKAGVSVVSGVLVKEASALNRDYHHWMKKKMPYVVAKIAQSLDGKIATKSGDSRWITGKEARKAAHELRAASDAVLVGINTVLKDNPRLNVRLSKKGPSPIKIILDGRLKIPVNARLFAGEPPERIMLVTTKRAPVRKRKLLQKKARIIFVKERSEGRADWKELLKVLGKMGIVKLLIEGGGEVLGSAFAEKIVNEIYFFVAPKIIGGKKSIGAVAGPDLHFLRDAAHLREVSARFVGEDLLIQAVI